MSSGYVDFHDRAQIAALDMGVYDSAKATVFPYGLYSGEPFMVANYICGEHVPRDTKSHYLIDKERRQHPDHFSRFGYGRAFYGYVSGHHPGRYLENEQCRKFDLPADMAPPRLYLDPHVGPSSTASAAHTEARAARLARN